jgi:diguanylate cyclase (GGDEF)-like protein
LPHIWAFFKLYSRRLSIVVLQFLLALCVSQAAYSSDFLSKNVFLLNVNKNIHTLENHWQYTVNENNLPSDVFLSQVEQFQWNTINEKSANFSYDEREYWFRFRLQSDTEEFHTYIVDVAYPLLDEIDLFKLDQENLVSHVSTGDSFVFSQRPVLHQNFIFPLEVNHKPSDIYLRVKSTSTLQVPLTIWPAKQFWQLDKIYSYLDGLFFGGILIMMIYNFFIFLSVKDKAYLFYVFYMLSLLLVQSANRGLGYQFLWPDSPTIQNYIIIPSLSGVVIFASLFFIYLLDLKTISIRSYRFFQAGIALTGLCVFSQLIFPYPTALSLTAFNTMLLGSGGALVALFLWTSGNRLAGYYIAGWGAVVFSFIFYIASVFDLIARTIIVEYATMVGTLAEVIIFSFALADRINLERRMRLSSQADLLEAQQEINQKLDVRVKQRTHELEIANAKLEEMSFSDGLTGVKNRRFFNEQIQLEYKRAYREQSPISLILGDIDYFKMVNDKYGHLAGDDCLVEVANTLTRVINRPGDALSRYGGEEFAIILPKTSLDGANLVAKKIRKEVETIRVATQEGKDISLTISLGVVSYIPKLRSGIENLIQKADEQLYNAKEAGRNCVCSSDVE